MMIICNVSTSAAITQSSSMEKPLLKFLLVLVHILALSLYPFPGLVSMEAVGYLVVFECCCFESV